MNTETPNAEAAAGKAAILEADAAQGMPASNQEAENAKQRGEDTRMLQLWRAFFTIQYSEDSQEDRILRAIKGVTANQQSRIAELEAALQLAAEQLRERARISLEYVAQSATALLARDKRIAELERGKTAHLQDTHEIEQRLGHALKYPLFASDPANFPDATVGDGVCVGEMTAPALAEEAANRITELEDEANWIRQKLELPADADKFKVFGRMHVVCAHSNGYERYIAAYKCDDKQGEIARQSVRIAELDATLKASGIELIPCDECDDPNCRARIIKPKTLKAYFESAMAQKIIHLERQLADANRFLANESLTKRNAELEAENKKLKDSREHFYQKRLDLIQSYQRVIPDPYRQILCNIIANGSYSASVNEEAAILAAIAESEVGK